MKVVQIASRPREDNIPMTNDVGVHCVVDSLPLEYEQAKVFYTALKEEQNINELISVCIQEEAS